MTPVEWLTFTGTLIAAGCWAGALLSEVKSLNRNLTEHKASNSDEHGKIWQKLDHHGNLLSDHGERIGRLED
jgi:hypothetical protein